MATAYMDELTCTSQESSTQGSPTHGALRVWQLQQEQEERTSRIAEILSALQILHPEPSAVVEIRCLNIPRGNAGKSYTAAGFFDDKQQAAKRAYNWDTKEQPRGCYVTINQLYPGVLDRAPNKITPYLQTTTSDSDIMHRRWLFVDIDPQRPAGIAATDQEKAASLELANTVEERLRARGWPLPLTQDSGNGYYLLWRVDLPHTEEITALIKRFYAGLQSPQIAGTYDPSRPHATIDTAVYNAARIIRLAGTVNRKGCGSAERPHRIASLGELPEELQVVNRSKIEEIAALAGPPASNKATHQQLQRQSGARSNNAKQHTSYPLLDVGRYLTDRGVSHTIKADADRIVYQLDRCPFNPSHGANKESAIIQNGAGLTTYHCMHDSCSGHRWQDVIATLGTPGREHLTRPGPQNGQQAQQAGQQDAQGGQSEPEASPEPPRFAALLSSKDFLAADYRQEFLVRDVLVAGQPAVIGGRSKTLKTSIACDLVVSLGSGTPFLGRFRTKRTNVAFWSGESGAAVVRETAIRIAADRRVNLADCSAHWGFDLPKLGRITHLDALAELIQQHALEVVIVDPLYLSLLDAEDGGKPSDLFFMGSKLQPLTELGQTLGVTIVLLHHFRKNQPDEGTEPAGLEELSQAGVAEWARQWILLARRSPYQNDGRHELWMRCGGSAGHAGMFGVDIAEGVLEPERLTGRKWEVTVENVTDTRDTMRREKEKNKEKLTAEKEREHKWRVIDALKTHPNGETEKILRGITKLNPENIMRVIAPLIEEGYVVECKVEKSKGTYPGYRLTEKWKVDQDGP